MKHPILLATMTGCRSHCQPWSGSDTPRIAQPSSGLRKDVDGQTQPALPASSGTFSDTVPAN